MDNLRMPGDLRIWLLGGFRVEAAGHSVPAGEWRRSGATALVKLLALRPGHRLHREQVADLLWPDAPGAARLNKALHFARRTVGNEHLILQDDMLSLRAAELWVDVDAFEAAARRGDVEGALALYAGDLLPENRFDDWAGTRRAQLRDAVVPLLLDQAAARESRGDNRGAIASLERLIGLDRLHEQAYARLMSLEDRHVALRWYDRLAELLRKELEVEPGDEVQRVYRELTAPSTVAPQPDHKEERKLVTVLDADFRGVVDADPERNRRAIGVWTDLLCEVLQRWGGAVQKRVGGGVVAVFGYPAAREEHADRALWAGFEILQRLPVAIRLGVDTGEIIAPALLPDIGGAVLDGAARLREAAGPHTLLAAERTRLAARHGHFRFRGGRLLSASWAPDERRREHEAPMVGRTGEIRAVLGLIEEAEASRRPRLLTITGAAGIGKTRLVREVLLARPDTRVLRGRCLAAGDGITYWALGEILREACGIPLGDSGPQTQQRLRTRLAQLFRGRSDVDATIFALATTAAVRLPDNPLDAADPRAVAEELGRAWPRFASAFAQDGPVIMVVEDLHWAGKPLVDMLIRLVARSTGPVVVLATARPEFGGFGAADVSTVSLGALTDEASRELLTAKAVDPRRRDEILARAEGNPYFLDELAAHLAEGGAVTLPDTLHALLAARVDALPAPEKRLLQAASVMGRVFRTEPLGEDLDDELGALEARGLIVARDNEFAFKHALLRDVAYASLPAARRAHGHADVAAWLEELSRERVGEVIELVAFHYAAAADTWHAIPGEDRKGDWVRGKAFRSLVAAGTGARRRYAIAKALDLHKRALRYASGAGERAEAMEAIGDDHETAYAGDEAARAWREAITILRTSPGFDDRRAELCLKTARMAVARWGGFRAPAEPAMADRVIDEGLAAVSDPPTKAQLLSLRALCGGRWAWTGLADPVAVEQRRAAAAAAFTLADRLASPSLRGLALLGRAAVHFLDGRYPEAVEVILDEVKLVERDGRDRDRALGHTIAGLVLADVRGDYRLSLNHALRSYETARPLSPHDRLHATYLVMANLLQLGRWSEMEPYLDEHLTLRDGPEREMSCPYIKGGPLIGALGMARRGDRPGARSVAAGVPVDLEHPGNTEALRGQLAIELGDARAGRNLAELLVRRGRRPGPEEIPYETLVLVEALEALGEHEALARLLPSVRATAGFLATVTPTCDRAEGVVRAAAGDRATAQALFTRAVAGFDRLSMPLAAARARERLATVSPRRSGQLRAAALEAYTRLGAEPDAERVRNR
ncbi:AAA family ATPase [Actinoplanes sp. TBRC 11911]|uniref:AAA family ATPase n=1 Tax=Actinoplanes sp. TBRC 11911 TaxID=2729386 RepID=UPI00145F7C65|nr:AAA family ATPase [Actinoplanes sp. TBRC 11911]NMO49730.1 AAA family ATPase [Actinoplanes sp. TBRC 11911]